MLFIEDIEILRKHIIRMIIGIIFCTLILMFNKKIIFDFIILAPAKKNFITYKLLKNIDFLLGKQNTFSLKENLKIQNRKIFGQFNIYMWVSIFGGILLSFPYILYEIWQFIKPALYIKEKKYIILFFYLNIMLFILGILFGYFILFPITIQFGYDFQISNLPENIFDLSDYISILLQSVFSMGIIFLMPIIIYFLYKIQLIEINTLKKYRKHVFLLLLIIAAAITPNDILSTLIITLPIIILYELSIYIIPLLL